MSTSLPPPSNFYILASPTELSNLCSWKFSPLLLTIIFILFVALIIAVTVCFFFNFYLQTLRDWIHRTPAARQPILVIWTAKKVGRCIHQTLQPWDLKLRPSLNVELIQPWKAFDLGRSPTQAWIQSTHLYRLCPISWALRPRRTVFGHFT